MAGRATHGLPGRPWRRTSCSMSGISHLSAAVTVDRAGHELRRGRPVLLTLGQGVEQQRALVLAAATLPEAALAALPAGGDAALRSDERRVGKECAGKGRSGWLQSHKKKRKKNN